jgi:hypothetical protein
MVIAHCYRGLAGGVRSVTNHGTEICLERVPHGKQTALKQRLN